MADKANAKDAAVKKPPIETASWCFRDKEEDVHHDFAWTITNFSRKINLVPNGACGEKRGKIVLTKDVPYDARSLKK